MHAGHDGACDLMTLTKRISRNAIRRFVKHACEGERHAAYCTVMANLRCDACHSIRTIQELWLIASQSLRLTSTPYASCVHE
jgi:hypothetical protein